MKIANSIQFVVGGTSSRSIILVRSKKLTYLGALRILSKQLEVKQIEISVLSMDAYSFGNR
jgi:hypothetical protein